MRLGSMTSAQAVPDIGSENICGREVMSRVGRTKSVRAMATVVWEQGMAWYGSWEKPTLRLFESKAKSQAGVELWLPGPPGFLSGSCASNHSLLPAAVIKEDGSEGRRKRTESVYLRKATLSCGGFK